MGQLTNIYKIRRLIDSKLICISTKKIICIKRKRDRRESVTKRNGKRENSCKTTMTTM
jgi:hypothetical protein